MSFSERERDWLLKKLRDEKRRYNFLKDGEEFTYILFSCFVYTLEHLSVERLKYGAIADSNSSMTSAASDSSFSIELLHDRSAMQAVMASTGKKRPSQGDWRSRLEHDIQAVNRDPAMISTLPLLVNTQALVDQQQTGYARGAGVRSSSADGLNPKRNKKEKRALAELVTLRARQEGIRDYISHCAACCGRGVWTKVTRR